MLADSLGVDEPQIRLNLGHSYFQLGDTANAKSNYHSATSADNQKLKSAAYQQLGVLAKNGGNLNESLQYLKSSIKADPANDGARYDYEVVKKLIQQQKENQQNQDKNDQKQDDQNKQDQNKQDQQNKDQQDQDQKDQQKSEEQKQDKDSEKSKEDKEAEEKQKQENAEEKENQQENVRQKLEEMNISEEKAQMILEAMKNNEVQYLQQRKRKAMEQPQSGKPDW